MSACKHCGRRIELNGHVWIDPAATGDDDVWRDVCDAHDTFTAEHEPAGPYDYDRPDALNPAEWELGIVTTTGATVLVSKVGGGTLGRTYDGCWHYSYSRRDRHVEGSDLTTPAVDHWQAAGIVAEFIEQDDE